MGFKLIIPIVGISYPGAIEEQELRKSILEMIYGLSVPVLCSCRGKNDKEWEGTLRDQRDGSD